MVLSLTNCLYELESEAGGSVTSDNDEDEDEDEDETEGEAEAESGPHSLNVVGCLGETLRCFEIGKSTCI